MSGSRQGRWRAVLLAGAFVAGAGSTACGSAGATFVCVGTFGLCCPGTLCYFLVPGSSVSHKASEAWSCPESRLTTVSVTTIPPVEPVPPPDIAADPDRLSIWRDNHEAGDPKYEYHLQGCGKDGRFVCHYAKRRSNSGWYCDEESSPNAPPQAPATAPGPATAL